MADEVVKDQEEAVVDSDNTTSDAVTEDLDAQRLRQELQETEDQLLRTAAELENYRRRTRRELDEQRKYAALQ